MDGMFWKACFMVWEGMFSGFGRHVFWVWKSCSMVLDSVYHYNIFPRSVSPSISLGISDAFVDARMYDLVHFHHDFHRLRTHRWLLGLITESVFRESTLELSPSLSCEKQVSILVSLTINHSYSPMLKVSLNLLSRARNLLGLCR